MMKGRKTVYRRDRRNFFRKAAVLGAAAVLGGARARRAKAAAAAEPAGDGHTGSRYRLTAHIRKYYEHASL